MKHTQERIDLSGFAGTYSVDEMKVVISEMNKMLPKKFYIVQFIGGEKYYVSGIYLSKIRCSTKSCDAIRFRNERDAMKYLKKIKELNYGYGEFSIREFE